MSDPITTIAQAAFAAEQALTVPFKWPQRDPEDRARMRVLMDTLALNPGSDSRDARQELYALKLKLGRKYRDCGVPREDVLDIKLEHPSTRGVWALVEGWDQRDAEISFWRRAYCA